MGFAGSATVSDPDQQLELVLHPVSMYVRVLVQRNLLEFLIEKFYYSDEASGEDTKKISDVLNSIARGLKPRIKALDSGLARTMEFCLFPERRESDWALLEKLRKDLLESNYHAQEVSKRFCDMAAALAKDSKLLRALKGIAENPAEPLRPDPIGDLVYQLPIVKGPGGFSQPFGLDTKHGHLVFVFDVQSELFEPFFEASAETLKPGFELEEAVIAVPRPERLGPELAALMPAVKSFLVVLEGTDIFSEYLHQLSEDTIWED